MNSAWTPIEPLSEDELAVDVSEFESVILGWSDAREALERDGAANLARFREQLRRSWSVETGILENLYMIDRGTTQTLIDRGFHQDLINWADAGMDPALLVEILKDHLTASEMLQAAIEDGTPVTPHFIRQLHALITRHQPSVEAIDTLGNPIRVEPVRGQWKLNPNWREMEDGRRVAYCPPEQVEGQVSDLLEWWALQEEQSVPLPIMAAWLHHRFTLIHPFQDGNGRVARALVNYVFIKNGLFPVVIDREEKPAYIDALQMADAGDISALARLLADKQVEAIKQALSLTRGEELERPAKVKDLAGGILQKLRHRRQREQAEFRGVNQVIQDLCGVASEWLERSLADFKRELQLGNVEVSTDLDAGGSHDNRDHYYRWETVESAKQARRWANFDEETRWLRALVQGRSTRLRFILSFHHVGRELTGVAEATAIADLEGRGSEGVLEAVQAERQQLPCMERPFSFTWRDDVKTLRPRFEAWLEECLLIALRGWSETI